MLFYYNTKMHVHKIINNNNNKTIANRKSMTMSVLI